MKGTWTAPWKSVACQGWEKGSLSLRTDAYDSISLAKECDLYSEDNGELLKDF